MAIASAPPLVRQHSGLGIEGSNLQVPNDQTSLGVDIDPSGGSCRSASSGLRTQVAGTGWLAGPSPCRRSPIPAFWIEPARVADRRLGASAREDHPAAAFHRRRLVPRVVVSGGGHGHRVSRRRGMYSDQLRDQSDFEQGIGPSTTSAGAAGVQFGWWADLGESSTRHAIRTGRVTRSTSRPGSALQMTSAGATGGGSGGGRIPCESPSGMDSVVGD